IPEHIGLGSGTQLALATATALQKILNTNATIPQLATTMGRAQRTGVGTAIFQNGGFVVDAGKNPETNSFPTLIFQQPFPENWRFVVAIPNVHKGLAKDQEKKAFQQLTPMSAEAVGKICRLIVMKLLPAIAENEIEIFGEALTQIQETVGDNFAKAQGGRYASTAAADTINFLKTQGAYGTGQSSWGPAVYGLFKKEQTATAQQNVKAFLEENVGGKAFTAKPNNTGAEIKLT
ncbi:MAG TPA: beta-ribofuranosylaminobenzene 5'-phosphate synthase family protein, partial [Oculatellaceae cyanobacterium]